MGLRYPGERSPDIIPEPARGTMTCQCSKFFSGRIAFQNQLPLNINDIRILCPDGAYAELRSNEEFAGETSLHNGLYQCAFKKVTLAMAGRDAGRCHDVVAAGLRARHVHLYESRLVLYP